MWIYLLKDVDGLPIFTKFVLIFVLYISMVAWLVLFSHRWLTLFWWLVLLFPSPWMFIWEMTVLIVIVNCDVTMFVITAIVIVCNCMLWIFVSFCYHRGGDWRCCWSLARMSLIFLWCLFKFLYLAFVVDCIISICIVVVFFMAKTDVVWGGGWRCWISSSCFWRCGWRCHWWLCGGPLLKVNHKLEDAMLPPLTPKARPTWQSPPIVCFELFCNSAIKEVVVGWLNFLWCLFKVLSCAVNSVGISMSGYEG